MRIRKHLKFCKLLYLWNLMKSSEILWNLLKCLKNILTGFIWFCKKMVDQSFLICSKYHECTYVLMYLCTYVLLIIIYFCMYIIIPSRSWNGCRSCFKKSTDFLESSAIAEILPEIIEWGPPCITELFQNNSVAYFTPK